MEKLKIIFVGTDEVGAELLRKLSKLFYVVLVVTGQDKPAGRKLQLQPSPIKLVAEELELEVFQPLDINADLSVRRMANLNPDIILVMAYGQILSREVLDIPGIACLNVHASLLPKYRGASPIQSSILNMDKKTGISLMKMVSKMDAGPVYRQFELSIAVNDTSQTLSDKLAKLSAEEAPGVLIEIEGGLQPEAQNEAKASYCGKISKSDGQIDWNHPAREVMAQMRAFDPWPGTYTFFGDKRLKILSATIHEGVPSGEPGLVKRDGIVCGDGLIHPLELQIEGGNTQSLHDFINGHPDFIGTRLK
ncbi:methionyl-tRNA formyltransferase [Patescibacteria group bacterium]|nr:methionyl-tRNA formyltransferase [Patescibacteria group bacterium]MBU1015590.1 methionyl-tRNA formyltransferase [Patescibacteria group bacterium]MBU1685538.1 methionyl-tRNA formyltransferase [Patescibacteria group bacterium]MBU1938293.1 methionyl-tRNA formyltransferase [Patescibacteria group bacterium]